MLTCPFEEAEGGLDEVLLAAPGGVPLVVAAALTRLDASSRRVLTGACTVVALATFARGAF